MALKRTIERISRIIGWLFVVPAFAMVLVWSAYSSYSAGLGQSAVLASFFLLILLGVYASGLYSAWQISREELRSTRIRNAPEEIIEVLKGKRSSVYRALIRALGEAPEALNQSELIAQVEYSVDLTDERIRSGYIKDMERLGLVTVNRGFARNELSYRLSKRGEWCFRAIKQYFPESQLWRIIRRDIRFIQLEPLPDGIVTDTLLAEANSTGAKESQPNKNVTRP